MYFCATSSDLLDRPQFVPVFGTEFVVRRVPLPAVWTEFLQRLLGGNSGGRLMRVLYLWGRIVHCRGRIRLSQRLTALPADDEDDDADDEHGECHDSDGNQATA